MRKSLNILLLVMMALALFVGCTPAGTEPEAPAKEEVTAEEEIPVSGEGQTVYIFSKLVEINDQILEAGNTFAAKYYPGAKFEVETTDIDYATTLKTKFAGGQEPTIFMVQGGDEATLWAEHLEDLSDQPWVDSMIESGKPAATVDGKLVGWPIRVEAQFYVINKDMFEEAGITEMPDTLTELEDVFEKLKSAGFGVTDNEYGDAFQGGMFIMNMGIARQEDPLAFIKGLDEGTETIANNPVFLDLANWITLDVSYDDNPLNTDFARQVSKFTNKEAAIMSGGTWTHTAVKAADPDMRVGMMTAPINDDPTVNGKVYSNIAPYMVVNKDDPAKEIAKDFLTWLVTDEEGIHYYSTVFQFIPAFTNVEPDKEAIGDLGVEALDLIKQGETYGMYMAYWPDGGLDAFGATFQKFVAGQTTPEELTQELQADWERLSQ